MSTPSYRNKFPLPTGTAPESFGVNYQFIDWNLDHIPFVAAAGIKWVRIDFLWSFIETVQGVYDFSRYDTLFDTLSANGIRIWALMAYGNNLYLSPAQQLIINNYPANSFPPDTELVRSAFCNFCVAAINHFKERGIIWELWNEPNGDNFWPPVNNATDYATLALQWQSAVRAVSPDEWLAGPALSTFDWDYFAILLQNGAINDFDTVSIHPYRDIEPETVIADWNRLRALITQATGKSTILTSSEWGYAKSAFPPPTTPTTYQSVDLLGNTAGVRRNVLTGTNDLDNALWLAYWIKPALIRVTDPLGGNNAFQLASADTTNPPKYYSGLMLNGSPIVDQYYTVSVYLRTTSGTLDVRFGITDSESDGSGWKQFRINSTWTRYSFCTKVSATRSTLFIVAENTPSNVTWQVAFPQLETVNPDLGSLDDYQLAQQADYLMRMFKSNVVGGANLSIWYNWYDPDNNPTTQLSGLRNFDNSFKPAYINLQNVSNALAIWDGLTDSVYKFQHLLQNITPDEDAD